jgi:hypothetical protein
MSMDGVLKLPEAPLMLTREMLTVTREQWPLERLAPLVHIDAHDRARRKRDGLAGLHEVIVIHGRAS